MLYQNNQLFAAFLLAILGNNVSDVPYHSKGGSDSQIRRPVFFRNIV